MSIPTELKLPHYRQDPPGTHPPLGVTDTTHPSASADSIDVVPAWNDS